MLRADQLGTVESASVEAPSYTKEAAAPLARTQRGLFSPFFFLEHVLERHHELLNRRRRFSPRNNQNLIIYYSAFLQFVPNLHSFFTKFSNLFPQL